MEGARKMMRYPVAEAAAFIRNVVSRPVQYPPNPKP
jgi:hypothetical protein